MTAPHPQLDLVGVPVVDRCPSQVLVLGRTLRCRWHAGHRGDGASLFDFHGARFQTSGVDVLITWTDALAGGSLSAGPRRAPRKTRDRRKARLLEVPRG